MRRRHKHEADADERPPICPACGVTQSLVVKDGETRYACLECGFSDEEASSA